MALSTRSTATGSSTGPATAAIGRRGARARRCLTTLGARFLPFLAFLSVLLRRFEIDHAFGDLGQLRVRRLLLNQRFLQQIDDLVQLEQASMRDRGPVRGDLVVFDPLGRAD